jgi:hypothetical protein
MKAFKKRGAAFREFFHHVAPMFRRATGGLCLDAFAARRWAASAPPPGNRFTKVSTAGGALSLQHTSAAAIRPSVLSPQRTVLTWQQGSKLDRLLFHEVSVLARRAGDLARGKPQVVAADARMDSAQAIESGVKTLTGGHVQQARRSLAELGAIASFGMKDLQVYRTVCGVTALLTAVSQRLRSSVKVEWPAILEAEASIADLCCAMIDVLWKHSVLHEGEGERRSPPAGIDASDLNLGLSSYTLSGVLAKAPELATTRWLILACSREIATGERFLDRTVFKAHISVRRLHSLQRRQRDTANEELHRTADALLGRVLLQDMVVLASPQLSAARREVVMKQAVMPASALRLAADPPAVPPHRIQQVLSNALYLLTRANLIAHYAAVILPLLSVDGILSAEQAHAESRGRHLWRHLLGPTLLGLASRYSVASSEELALLTRIAADYTAACAEECQPRAITLLASAVLVDVCPRPAHMPAVAERLSELKATLARTTKWKPDAGMTLVRLLFDVATVTTLARAVEAKAPWLTNGCALDVTASTLTVLVAPYVDASRAGEWNSLAEGMSLRAAAEFVDRPELRRQLSRAGAGVLLPVATVAAGMAAAGPEADTDAVATLVRGALRGAGDVAAVAHFVRLLDRHSVPEAVLSVARCVADDATLLKNDEMVAALKTSSHRQLAALVDAAPGGPTEQPPPTPPPHAGSDAFSTVDLDLLVRSSGGDDTVPDADVEAALQRLGRPCTLPTLVAALRTAARRPRFATSDYLHHITRSAPPLNEVECCPPAFDGLTRVHAACLQLPHIPEGFRRAAATSLLRVAVALGDDALMADDEFRDACVRCGAAAKCVKQLALGAQVDALLVWLRDSRVSQAVNADHRRCVATEQLLFAAAEKPCESASASAPVMYRRVVAMLEVAIRLHSLGPDRRRVDVLLWIARALPDAWSRLLQSAADDGGSAVNDATPAGPVVGVAALATLLSVHTEEADRAASQLVGWLDARQASSHAVASGASAIDTGTLPETIEPSPDQHAEWLLTLMPHAVGAHGGGRWWHGRHSADPAVLHVHHAVLVALRNVLVNGGGGGDATGTHRLEVAATTLGLLPGDRDVQLSAETQRLKDDTMAALRSLMEAEAAACVPVEAD